MDFIKVTKEPTYISDNFSSCMDLLFTLQPDLITELGVHPSLNRNCYHQISSFFHTRSLFDDKDPRLFKNKIKTLIQKTQKQQQQFL